MKKSVLIAGVAALSMSTPLAAQYVGWGGVGGVNSVNTSINTLETNVASNLGGYGALGYAAPGYSVYPTTAGFLAPYTGGWRGSFSLSGSSNTSDLNAASGSEDTRSDDLSIGARLSNVAGLWQHTVSIFGKVSVEEGDSDVEVNEFKVGYDGNRMISGRYYAYGAISANSSTADILDFDGVASIGVGARIVDTPISNWRVQGGPAYVYTAKDGDVSTNQEGALLSSRITYQMSPRTSLTNDTDYVWSENFEKISNDLALNYKLTDTISARLGYLTEYEGDEVNMAETTKNNVNVSAVLSF